MRRFVPLLVLAVWAAACGPVAPPWDRPAPTPTPLIYPTPRPAPPRPTATAVPTLAPQPTSVVATATEVPRLGGTPVTVTTPLVGLLLDDEFFSPVIGEQMTYRIYLPPDYERVRNVRYPVVYLLHGAGGNYTEWTDSMLPERVDELIVSGEVPPLIVVMPDGGGQTYWANWSQNGPRWADYVTDDVVRIIDQRYRTLPDRASRAIGGLSMGGLGALNLAFQRPDVFGVVGGHSPSVRLDPDPALWFLAGETFWENNPAWLAEHRSDIDSVQIWLDAGTEDVWLPNIKAVHDALVQRGLQPSWNVYPGPHEAEYWIEHLPDYLRFYGAALKR